MKEILYFCRELNRDPSVFIPSLSHYRDYATLQEVRYPITTKLFHIFSRCFRITLRLVQVSVYGPYLLKPALFLSKAVNSRTEYCSIVYTQNIHGVTEEL